MERPLTAAQRRYARDRLSWSTLAHAEGREEINGPTAVAIVSPYPPHEGHDPDGGWYVSVWGHDRGSGGWYATREEAMAVALRQTGLEAHQPSLLDLM